MRHPLGHGAALATVLAAGLLAVAGPATALEPAGDLATVNVSSAGIDFRPEVEFDRAILTVSGGGEVFRHEFAPGEDPFLSVFGADGQSLADGTYVWELILLPTQDARVALMIATTENGGETPGAREAQRGAFAIVDGYLADPELQEVGARSPSADLSGFASSAPESVALGERAPSDLSADLDSDSGVCNGAAKYRSASCEAEANAAARSQSSAADPFTADLGNRTGLGDSDFEVAAGVAAESIFEPQTDSSEATAPRRTYDPEGANGRPRSEEDQR